MHSSNWLHNCCCCYSYCYYLSSCWTVGLPVSCASTCLRGVLSLRQHWELLAHVRYSSLVNSDLIPLTYASSLQYCFQVRPIACKNIKSFEFLVLLRAGRVWSCQVKIFLYISVLVGSEIWRLGSGQEIWTLFYKSQQKLKLSSNL